MKYPRLAAALLALATPAVARAQVSITPQADAPTTLNPGATGNQAPPANPQTIVPAPQQPQRPGVVIVGPDGKVIGGDPQDATDNTYYVPGQMTDPYGYGGEDYSSPVEVHNGAVPELHIVRSGDTLWDICWFYFNDPWQWPKVWSYNPQITNPHWIYPGDLVRLLPRGVFASSGPINQDPETPVGARTVDPVPAPAVRSEVGIKRIAFVEKADLEKSIVIDGAVDEKVMLGEGDQVYLSYPKDHPPKVGATYSIYLPGQPVRSGKSELGSYVKLIGTLQVVSAKEDKRARGVILQSDQEIERGAKVGPLLKSFQNVEPVAPTVDAQAPIVAQLTKDQLIGESEIVFVQLGKSSGVKVGNRMYVVRRGDARPDLMSNEVGSDDRRFPARALGEVVIVEVGENVSIGLVTLSVQEMSVGDLVMMQKAP